MTEEKQAQKQPRRRHPRRPDLSQNRILEAAVVEFAANGLTGTRVEAIAERAEINKRMIYQYFGSKELLYQAVIEKVYRDVWDAEAALNLEQLPPRDALIALVTFVWTYYLEHPEFITILNSENQLKAIHFKKSRAIREGAASSRPLVDDILRRGEADGTFRLGIDPIQLSLTITSICYYYFTNQATSSIVYGQRMMTRAALERRLAFNIQTVLAIVSPDRSAL
ncbi:TetR family transcriptional regulator [Agrobacterium vitis]|uniref:TetR/AcrR family transcriptional regulator n=1 Tax=Agrobacterium vitis TaxID=373 RepID=UPI00135DE786|nr:TetR/AcrR family transcriptional regulator [Agrobacterium vitis]MVA54133.1 TetR family transcriptional regulator [Agrobacterium vitis]NSZ20211.1 TetR/AcrR family transcriptional regulator [Agrobacterium vitis]QZO07549.1 TetR family transcriptional regulator [Agrobacterium vitis]UJL90744.1 TetR family transcriptional regulator [Agrobacterium vitis]